MGLRWWGRAMLAERSGTEAASFPSFCLRGRSILALVVAPTSPLDGFLAALDEQIRRTPGLFSDRPVVADLGGISGCPPVSACIDALDALADRELKLVGVEGVDCGLLSGTPWGRLPTALRGREVPQEPTRRMPTARSSLLIDRPVRSGQSIIFEDGDVTVIGAVSSGAEVIAGGSIHVYGALRGRAIAGVTAGKSARIFCRALEAELVAVGGFYQTAESWGPGLKGRAMQIRCEGEALQFAVLD
jgi:septum site-determining protein MinC